MIVSYFLALNGLKTKIILGKYPKIPEFYSLELKDLIQNLLVVNPKKRICIKEILKTELIQKNISIIVQNSIDEVKNYKKTEKMQNF